MDCTVLSVHIHTYYLVLRLPGPKNSIMGCLPVADPGFPRGGEPTLQHYFVNFSQKLHEIERIWAPRSAYAVRIFRNCMD